MANTHALIQIIVTYIVIVNYSRQLKICLDTLHRPALFGLKNWQRSLCKSMDMSLKIMR
jgi:hypothetical protein